jgi:hypothetical protein
MIGAYTCAQVAGQSTDALLITGCTGIIMGGESNKVQPW